MAHHKPFEYYVCIDKKSSNLTSLQLTFADDDGEDLVKMPLIGPEIGEELFCGTFQFTDRGAPVEVRIFEQDDILTGLGILYPVVEDLVKLGRANKDIQIIAFEEN